MNGKRLITGFLIFLGIFAIALVYTQFFAYYQNDDGVAALRVGGGTAPVTAYDGIDSASSPLKKRGCFRLDPAAVVALPVAEKPTPLAPPFWFRCFDTGAITDDIGSGAATAYLLARDDPEGFDTVIAVYRDGRGYLWRQFGPKYADQG